MYDVLVVHLCACGMCGVCTYACALYIIMCFCKVMCVHVCVPACVMCLCGVYVHVGYVCVYNVMHMVSMYVPLVCQCRQPV